uniref:Dynein light chain n=1 Tax=Scleropages formosus TaxID=113540 RepID=A0A8C9QZC4_SCLFO
MLEKTRLEQQDSHLTQVEVDEVFGFVRYVAAEIPAHNAVPCGVVLLVELLMGGTKHIVVHCILLHVLRHVSILDHSLSVSHDACVQQWRRNTQV